MPAAATDSTKSILTAALTKIAGEPTARGDGPEPERRARPNPTAPEAKGAAAPPPELEVRAAAPFVPPDEDGTPAPEVKATPEPEERFEKVELLREAYKKSKSDLATLTSERDSTKKERDELAGKTKTYEERIKSLEAAEAKAVELEKQVLTYDERLRIRDYLDHPEFHEKFVKPVAEAVQSAHALVKDLVVDAEGEPRAGTPQDFDTVLGAPNLTEAVRRAKELFGADLYQTVINQRQTVLTAQRNRAEAMKEAATKSAEWVKSQSQQQAKIRETLVSSVEKEIQTQREKYKAFYVPDEKDAEAVKAYRAGESIADLAMNPGEMPQGKLVEVLAKTRNRAAAFPLLALKLQREIEAHNATKAKLKGYEKTEPNVEGAKRTGSETVAKTMLQDPRAQIRSDLEKYASKT